MKNFELLKATEAAAIAASVYIGSGDKILIDLVASEAMGKILQNLPYNMRVVMSEGEKDKAPMLNKGVINANFNPTLDFSCDPVDGTTQVSIAGSEAMSVLAVSEKNTMFDTEEYYMLKLAMPQRVAEKCPNLDLNTPLSEICKKVAQATGKSLNKLMVCILNRPRHDDYIKQMRELGVRIKLIQDCDISGAITTCLPDSGIDIQFGIGGAPEAVITAAAMKCLGGFFLGKIWKEGQFIGDQLTSEMMVKGECVFVATGITNGSLLKGVRFDQQGKPITNSVFMRSKSGSVRWLTTYHGN